MILPRLSQFITSLNGSIGQVVEAFPSPVDLGQLSPLDKDLLTLPIYVPWSHQIPIF